ncbi:MAG: N-6 DNA methylase, partial [Candidatus Marinimicrobia bacterium]|nr:N-6 DNA methylase [Candidatus Neomarinimicrobiota bacterium]
PNHTAQAQLVGILADDQNNPTLTELETAFSVDAVTKQFYKDYRAQFEKLWNELNDIVSKDPKIAKEFETKTIDTANFAKKLMGQIVFLYFLQKKGWLGVGKDSDGNFKDWGTGPKNFMGQLFSKEKGESGKIKFTDYGNFFNDVLEPLFYVGLASEQPNDYFPFLNCKIPFLNGGLFEPINDYNWDETDIRIDNDLIGDVFKTFDQYNFTVREDEPLEKEVAVDPEMLGKVFENLLPENLRKGKGAYYTPRTIVHYMCQESLINYLYTECEPAPKEDIETLIREGEKVLEYESKRAEELAKDKNYKGEYSEPAISIAVDENAQALDDALANIKVCDPAIGSGAFPVGMLTEIIKARKVLELYLDKKLGVYELKRHCIQNSLYGVDIDPGAIEIAKLRLWLSLVVDEDDYTTIQPLPNLDYKIMQGNSLIEEFHGISLDIKKNNKTIDWTKGSQADAFFGGEKLDALIKDLHQKQKDFFNAEHPREKMKKREAVETAIYNIFHNELEKKKSISSLETKEIEADLKEMTHGNKVRNFFPWKLYFADIFREKGGFDIVIANPPYVNTKDVAKYEWRSNLESEFGWVDDLYNHFTHLAVNFSKNNGIVTFITSDTFFTIQTKANMRKLLLENEILHLIPTPKAFSAMVDTAIFIVKKNDNSDNYQFEFSDIRKPDFDQLGFSKQYIKSSGNDVATWERILDPLFSNLKSGKYYTKNIDINLFRENLNQVFFSPIEMNLQIKEKIIPSVKGLYDKYWDLIKTSREITKNSVKLNEYRESLKSGDLTMLGLVTEGGQGMATGNNGRFVGCLKNTKSARRILETRCKKLSDAFAKESSLFDSYPSFINCSSKNDFDSVLNRMTENEIRILFDEIKVKIDRDIFGQGYLFRIIDP